MNPSIISSILITLFGIFTGLSGSDWFWGVIILFPIFVGWRLDLISIAGFIACGFGLFIGLVASDWAIAFGDIIVFAYILLFVIAIGRIAWVKKGSAENISPYLIFSIVISIIWTIVISSMMPDVPIAISTVSAPRPISSWALVDQIKFMNCSSPITSTGSSQSVLDALRIEYANDPISMTKLDNITVYADYIEFTIPKIKIHLSNETDGDTTIDGNIYYTKNNLIDQYRNVIPTLVEWRSLQSSLPGNPDKQLEELLSLIKLPMNGTYKYTTNTVLNAGNTASIIMMPAQPWDPLAILSIGCVAWRYMSFLVPRDTTLWYSIRTLIN
jgi:hypothetical protein